MADDTLDELFGGGTKAKTKAKSKPKARAKGKTTTKSESFARGAAAGLKGKPVLGKTGDYVDGYMQGAKAKPKAKRKPKSGA